MDIKNNDLIIIIIVLVIAYLVFSHNEGFADVNADNNFKNVNSMLIPIQTNINNLISTIDNANTILKTINYSFDLFQRNKPSALYIADRMSGDNLTNLITGINDAKICKLVR